MDHVNDVKKAVRSGMCIGVGMGRKNGINNRREIMGNQMKLVRKQKNDDQHISIQ